MVMMKMQRRGLSRQLLKRGGFRLYDGWVNESYLWSEDYMKDVLRIGFRL